MDPDPIGFETFGRIRQKSFKINNLSTKYPINKIRILKNELKSLKLEKNYSTLYKSLCLKAEICNQASLQDGDTKVKFLLKILEKIYAGS